jgi:hypothetical protein
MPGEEVLRRLEIFANEIKNSQAADNEQ